MRPLAPAAVTPSRGAASPLRVRPTLNASHAATPQAMTRLDQKTIRPKVSVLADHFATAPHTVTARNAKMSFRGERHSFFTSSLNSLPLSSLSLNLQIPYTSAFRYQAVDDITYFNQAHHNAMLTLCTN